MLQLYNGDCLDILKEIPKNSIDMIFADLPYGTTQCKWDSIIPLDTLWPLLHACSKLHTPFLFTASGNFQYVLGSSQIDILKHTWIWDKVKPSSGLRAKIEPLRVFEAILVFCKSTPCYNPQMVIKKLRQEWKNDSNGEAFGNKKVKRYHNNQGLGYPKDILTLSNANQRNRVHGTQKPVELMEYLIKTYSNEGDIILDPTMGSGTTGIAALNLKRSFIGIEKDKAIFDIAKDRIKQYGL